jgi:hypothetical protein
MGREKGGRVEVSPNVQRILLISLEVSVEVSNIKGNPSVGKQRRNTKTTVAVHNVAAQKTHADQLVSVGVCLHVSTTTLKDSSPPTGVARN